MSGKFIRWILWSIAVSLAIILAEVIYFNSVTQ